MGKETLVTESFRIWFRNFQWNISTLVWGKMPSTVLTNCCPGECRMIELKIRDKSCTCVPMAVVYSLSLFHIMNPESRKLFKRLLTCMLFTATPVPTYSPPAPYPQCTNRFSVAGLGIFLPLTYGARVTDATPVANSKAEVSGRRLLVQHLDGRVVHHTDDGHGKSYPLRVVVHEAQQAKYGQAETAGT